MFIVFLDFKDFYEESLWNNTDFIFNVIIRESFKTSILFYEVFKEKKLFLREKYEEQKFREFKEFNKNYSYEDINKDISIINIWFKDLENSSQLETICINNKFDINQVRNVKIPEFRKVAELEYPTYQKFVSHFKNWIVKNPPKDLNAPLKMVY